jgi:hypothetical protein
MCVFLRLVAKMNDWFLEQWINIKFCVKLGKNASDTCAILSGPYEGEAMRKSNVFDWYKRFKVRSHVEITNEENSHHFLRCQGYCSLRSHFTRPNSQPSLLSGNAEADAWTCALKKVWTLVQIFHSPSWQCSSSQGALCQAVSGPKIDYWNATPILFPLLDSEWLLAVFKNKVFLKETNISG